MPDAPADHQAPARRVVVLACGNRSRGDDALGPLLIDQLTALNLANVSLVEDYQFQIEHALDMGNAELVLFIDASTECPPPFDFTPVKPAHASMAHTTHALKPEDVLATFQRIEHKASPPAFTLAIRGQHFDLGAGLSNAALTHLDAAGAFVKKLLAVPDEAAWRDHAANNAHTKSFAPDAA
jgi:hydrogenase maturation protease